LPPIVAGAALSTLPVKVGTGYCRLDARNEAGQFSLGVQNPVFKRLYNFPSDFYNQIYYKNSI
jgi:hypothetical protein